MALSFLRVIQTKSSKYSVGDVLIGDGGWRTHCVRPDSDSDKLFKLDPSLPTRPSAHLGVLGMPG